MNSKGERRAGIYYVGSFDDEILHYNHDGYNLDSINDTLSQAALFGGKLLINDGYLMHSKDGRDALTDERRSPLLDLMRSGYIHIYTRNGGDLARLPEQMAGTIPSYAALTRSSAWPALRDKLQGLPDTFDGKKVFELWPSLNFGPGFQRLANSALNNLKKVSEKDESTARELESFQTTFNARMDAEPSSPARTVWRAEYSSERFHFTPELKVQLHWIGLEAYHYNSAIASAKNNPTRRPGVITRYSQVFEHLRDKSTQPHVDGASLLEIPRPALPRDIDHRLLQDGQLLSEVVRYGTDLYNCKWEFLAAVDDALRDRAALPEARMAADRYGKELSAHIRAHHGSNSETLLKVVKLVAGAFLSVQLKAHLPASGFASQLESDAAKDALLTGTAWLTKRFITRSGGATRPLAVDVLDPLEDFREDIDSVSPEHQGSEWFSFLGIENDVIEPHLSSMPELRR